MNAAGKLRQRWLATAGTKFFKPGALTLADLCRQLFGKGEEMDSAMRRENGSRKRQTQFRSAQITDSSHVQHFTTAAGRNLQKSTEKMKLPPRDILNLPLPKWRSCFEPLQEMNHGFSVAVQRSAQVGTQGLVNFITAVAYHFCSSLPAAFTQPGASTLADLCI